MGIVLCVRFSRVPNDKTGIKKIRERYWKRRGCLFVFYLPVSHCVSALLPEVGNVAWHGKLSGAKLRMTSCVLLQLLLTPPQLYKTAKHCCTALTYGSQACPMSHNADVAVTILLLDN